MESNAEKWTVSRLKCFLKSRGIPCTGYAKHQLITMVQTALNQPHLVEEVQPSDGEDVKIRRRTILISGEEVVFPDYRTLSNWEENLNNIPYLTTAHCLMYLVMKREWSPNRVLHYEKENGYQLYLNKHIQNVKMKKLQFGVTCIKAICIRQTKQNEAPYDVWMLVSSNGDINTAGCQCTG